MDKVAKTEWDRLTPLLLQSRVLTQADGGLLAAYCTAYSRWRKAERLITKHGLTFETPNGYIQARPEVNIAKDSMRIMERMAQHFGISPASRSRVTAAPDKTSKNAFSSFGGRGSHG